MGHVVFVNVPTYEWATHGNDLMFKSVIIHYEY